jgi:hypothetical protein
MFDWWNSAEVLTRLNFIVQIIGAAFGVLIVVFGMRLAIVEARDKDTLEKQREVEAQESRKRIEESQQKAAALAAAIAPRRLNTSQIESLRAHLANAIHGRVEIEVPMGGEDSMDFAIQLQNVLQDLGYDVDEPYFSTRTGIKGLLLEIKQAAASPSAAGFLQQALRAAGFSCEAYINTGVPDNSTRLIVGPKS